jgi:hypothetical protein
VFWPFYLIFIIYGVYRLATDPQRPRMVQIVVVSVVVTGACVPVGMRAIALLHGASSHVVADSPSISDLLRELKLTIITTACAVTALLSTWKRWPPAMRTFPKGALVLVLAWWLLDPLVIFAFSNLTGNSLWVPRYMYLAVPGVSLAAALVTSVFLPARLWKITAVYLGCGVLVFTGHWNRLWPEHQRSDWRSAAHDLRTWVGKEDVPVICPSPFIEAQQGVWKTDYPVDGFLYSHLGVYPMAGKVYPFPFEASPEASEWGRQLARSSLQAAGRFAIYGGDRNVKYWHDWFASQPELRSWNSSVLALYGDVEIVTFSAH